MPRARSGCSNASRNRIWRELIENTCRDVAAASSEAEVMQLLRRMKAEAALLIALCDIGGVWPVMQVTAALTDLAVASVQCGAALPAAAGSRARQAVAAQSRCARRTAAASIVLAMGKMGAGELNYSSDIDLIVFFDPRAPTLAPGHRAAAILRARHAGAGAACCSSAPATAMCSASICGCGRIRPRPGRDLDRRRRSHYYEREGRTWERAAMIKARPCAGDAKAGEALLAEIAPFVWRKHLDFAALADVHDMKRQMQTFRGPERDRGRGPQRQGRAAAASARSSFSRRPSN